MARAEGVTDSQQLARLGRELRSLDRLAQAYESYQAAERDLSEVRDLVRKEDDPQMLEYMRNQEDQAEQRVAGLEEQLRGLLLPTDPNDDRDVVVEIQGAEGGQEAALFAADLFRMYSRWAESKGWKIDVVDAQDNGIGG